MTTLNANKTNNEPGGKNLSEDIWAYSIVACVLLSAVVGYFAEQPLLLALLCGSAALITTALTTAPYARFFDQGWKTRRDEFMNELYGDALILYLRHFWNVRACDAGALPPRGETTDAETLKKARALFLKVYDEQYGIGAFVVPLSFLLLIVFLNTHYVMLVGLGDNAPEAKTLLAYMNKATSGHALFAISAICGAFFFSLSATR